MARTISTDARQRVEPALAAAAAPGQRPAAAISSSKTASRWRLRSRALPAARRRRVRRSRRAATGRRSRLPFLSIRSARRHRSPLTCLSERRRRRSCSACAAPRTLSHHATGRARGTARSGGARRSLAATREVALVPWLRDVPRPRRCRRRPAGHRVLHRMMPAGSGHSKPSDRSICFCVVYGGNT